MTEKQTKVKRYSMIWFLKAESFWRFWSKKEGELSRDSERVSRNIRLGRASASLTVGSTCMDLEMS